MKIIEGIGRLSGGGAETQVKMLSNGLIAEGHEVVLAHVTPSTEEVGVIGGVKLCYLERRSKWDWKRIFNQVGQIFGRERPDIIHAWLPEVISIPMAVMAAYHRVPLITSIRRSTFKGVNVMGWVRDAMGIVAHFFSNHIVSNFPIDEEPWIVRSLALRKGHSVIRNGIDSRVFGGGCAKKEIGVSIRLVFVGRFAPQKRLVLLLRALAQIPEGAVTLTVFGSANPSVMAEHEALVEKLGLIGQVSFQGFQRNWRMHAGEFDALVTPSVSEGMPNVVVEAMAEYLPVLATEIPEISSIVSDGVNGFLFEPDSVDSIISSIERLRVADVGSLSLHARKTAETFSDHQMVADYISLYRGVIAKYER
ncbi:MAG: glycosyltransferase family 4 protein [Coraliomargaritaceae bacterium]